MHGMTRNRCLEKASVTRTTIAVAYRLSTFKSADKIAEARYGEIIELDTHDDLLRKGEYYSTLIKTSLARFPVCSKGYSNFMLI